MKFNSVLVAFISVFALALTACGDFAGNSAPESGKRPGGGGGGQGKPLAPELQKPNEGPFSREKMLYNMGLLLTEQVKRFQLESQLLTLELEKTCSRDALTSGDLSNARAQFRKAVAEFQSLMAAPIGPLQDQGRFLLDNLDSWPFVNYCGVDREVVRYDQTKEPASQLLYTVKGMGALDYLLHEGTLSSVCNVRAYPETQVWTARPAGEKIKTRCALALVFARDLESKSAQLWKAWNPEEGHFAKALVDGSRYPTLQAALNDFSDHLFRVEVVKDQKLGRPLGLHRDCLEDSCPDQAELKHSDLSLLAISRNLSMLESLYHGSRDPAAAGYGLDDQLRHLNRADVADRLKAALAKATATAKSLEDTGYQSLLRGLDASACARSTPQNRLVPACSLYQEVREVSRLMKAELLSVLDLRPPKTIEGDND